MRKRVATLQDDELKKITVVAEMNKIHPEIPEESTRLHLIIHNVP